MLLTIWSSKVVPKISHLRVGVDEISALLSKLFDLLDECLLNQISVSTSGGGEGTRSGNTEHLCNLQIRTIKAINIKYIIKYMEETDTAA